MGGRRAVRVERGRVSDTLTGRGRAPSGRGDERVNAPNRTPRSGSLVVSFSAPAAAASVAPLPAAAATEDADGLADSPATTGANGSLRSFLMPLAGRWPRCRRRSSSSSTLPCSSSSSSEEDDRARRRWLTVWVDRGGGGVWVAWRWNAGRPPAGDDGPAAAAAADEGEPPKPNPIGWGANGCCCWPAPNADDDRRRGEPNVVVGDDGGWAGWSEGW